MIYIDILPHLWYLFRFLPLPQLLTLPSSSDRLEVLIENLLDLTCEIASVGLEGIWNLLQKVVNIGKWKSFTFHYFFMILRSQILQLFICVVFGVIKGELKWRLFLFFFDICQLVRESRCVQLFSPLFFRQDHHHHLWYSVIPRQLAIQLLSPKSLHKKVKDVVMGVAGEKLSFIKQGKSKSFKTLI